jgi:hypothetical protein
MLNTNSYYNEDEIKKLIFESLKLELPKFESEICNYDIKQIIYEIAKKIIPDVIDWADPEKFGKNRILIYHRNKVLQLDTTELIESIKTLHKEHIEPRI